MKVRIFICPDLEEDQEEAAVAADLVEDLAAVAADLVEDTAAVAADSADIIIITDRIITAVGFSDLAVIMVVAAVWVDFWA